MKTQNIAKTSSSLVSKELAIPAELQSFFGKGAITCATVGKAFDILEMSKHLSESKKLLSFLVKKDNGAYYMDLLNQAQRENSPFLAKFLQFNIEYLSRQTSDIKLLGFSPSKKTDKKSGLVTWSFKKTSPTNEEKAKNRLAAESLIKTLPEDVAKTLAAMPKNSAADAAKVLELARKAAENLPIDKPKATAKLVETSKMATKTDHEGALKPSIHVQVSKTVHDLAVKLLELQTKEFTENNIDIAVQIEFYRLGLESLNGERISIGLNPKSVPTTKNFVVGTNF